jgi:lactate racemase
MLPVAQRVASAAGSPAAFMLRWARELVVDRSVLVYAPPLRERIGPRLGPVRLFDDQAALWQAAAVALDRRDRPAAARFVRVFPQGGLTYVPR